MPQQLSCFAGDLDMAGAVILAAGYSSRMKAFKPLLPVGGISALERQIRTLTEAGITRIVVVTGHNREKLMPLVTELQREAAGSIVEAYNADYGEGMFSSIRKGLNTGRKVFGDAGGFFLMPVDSPLISSRVILRMIEAMAKEEGTAAQKGHGNFYVPVFQGKKGHPLFIPAEYAEEICGYDGPDGLKAITDKYRERMMRVPVEEEGCVMDMDTPESYEEIEAFLAAGCRRDALCQLAAGRRIFLVRHGETRQHPEKMFIGRYDVPLEEGAGEDVKEMARRMADESPLIRVIYTSPLKRARQTAEILAEILEEGGRQEKQQPALCMIDDFQEISLGEWDGRPISWVKENFPEEYRMRGDDIFAFKRGNGAENFYDVQYRAVKALEKILKQDDARDVVIVTHSAVIRALENNLRGRKVDDEWKKISKNDFRMINLCR